MAVNEDTSLEQEDVDAGEFRMSLTVAIDEVGPCKKHVRVTVPQTDIEHYYGQAVGEMIDTADVPGFRQGRAPRKLVERRFREELMGQVKQKILVESLEQVAEDNDLDPINEPDLDVDSIELLDDADHEYEFDEEVRPEFSLPAYDGLKVDRPVRDVTDADVAAYQSRFLSQYGELLTMDRSAEAGDYLSVNAEFTAGDQSLNKASDLVTELKPILRFQDAELSGYDELMQGAGSGDTRETDVTISQESENVAMRGETVHAKFEVQEVKQLQLPELNRDFLQRIGYETEEDLQEDIRAMLERQVTFEQRQSARTQVIEQITESANWDLPEQLVSRQTENALRREILEMQQAGFTTHEIQSRENEIRQQAITKTRQALKEHFVLDKVATTEDIDVTPTDIEAEIQLMATQAGESPRRVRARLIKSGMIDNLEAQIRERKAVDVILERAEYVEVPMDAPIEDQVHAVQLAICGVDDSAVGAEDTSEETADATADATAEDQPEDADATADATAEDQPEDADE